MLTRLKFQLCYGDTLSEMLCKLSYADPICVLNWAIQIAKGMEHLHKRDDALVHADLKADNGNYFKR
jgi:serine/threonine protein kinase